MDQRVEALGFQVSFRDSLSSNNFPAWEIFIREIKMRKSLTFLVAAALSFTLSGCSSGMSEEAACKEYFNQYDKYLVAIMEGDFAAETDYAVALNTLAAKSPTALSGALQNDSLNVSGSYETAALCTPYLKG